MIKPPIVITETYDISIHPTVRHAEGFTEQWDVRKGIYIVYDSEGHLLNMRVETIRDEHRVLFFRWATNHETVVISEPPVEIDRSEELRDKLIQYLTIGRAHPREINKEDLNSLSLNELIRKVGMDMPWVLD